MDTARTALLTDRGVVRVTGPDAAKLLQGLVTNDMDHLATLPAIHAGLLAPQGKILFDFFVVRASDGFLLETAADKAGELAKRLLLYRLRAKVEIVDVTAEHAVAVQWGGTGPPENLPGVIVFADPRLPALGWRIILEAPADPATMTAGAADYEAHRVALGVPEGGKDFKLGDTFPHEADYDQLSGVSFTKGCYVGQEVVSRMAHRTTVRKRVVPIAAEGTLHPGSEIRIGEAVIGAVGSVAGEHALALVRLDRAAEALAKGLAITVDGTPVTVIKPDWATFDISPQKPTEPA